MLGGLLENGANALRKNYDRFSNGIMVKANPITDAERKAVDQYKFVTGNRPKQDKLVTGLDAIKMGYTSRSTGQYIGLMDDAVAVGALTATGLVAFKATQGGVSLLTGGSGW